MPRIRKKTSNRGTTRHRAKVTKKAAEQRKKNKKQAKRDPTWKSKKEKDLGVPNSFPYKDQVLAELAEEKRQSEEARLAKKAAAKPQAAVEEEEDTPGIQSLNSTKAISAPLTGSLKIPKQVPIENDVPDLVDTQLATLQDVLDKADVVLEVVDARDILGGRSKYVENLVKEAGSKVALLVNKIDLVPRETLEAWLAHLELPTFLFKSPYTEPVASTSKTPVSSTIEPTAILGKNELLSALNAWADAKSTKSSDELVVALMGHPTVGKTSVLNALIRGKRAFDVAPPQPSMASAKHPAPTTSAPVEVEVDAGERKIRVIDTPGWEFADEEEEDDETEGVAEEEAEPDMAKWDAMEERVAGDLLRRNLGRVDRVKDVFPLVNYIFKRSNQQDLMIHYNIPAFKEGDVDAFLTSLARANGRLKKHGDPNLEASARILLRDWAFNTLYQYATPPKTAVPSSSGNQVDMVNVLAKCALKRDLKRARALVRFRGGEIDDREVILDDDFTAIHAADSEHGDEDEGEDAEEDEDEVLDDDDDEDGEDEEEDELQIGSDDGEELELEDGPEPSSGSSIPSDEEDEEEEEEEEEEDEPIPQKGKRKALASPPSKQSIKKAKRVSFGRHVEPSKSIKGILKHTSSVPTIANGLGNGHGVSATTSAVKGTKAGEKRKR